MSLSQREDTALVRRIVRLNHIAVTQLLDPFPKLVEVAKSGH